ARWRQMANGGLKDDFSLSITVGGDAGQGVESSGALFTPALARGGWHVFGVPDYRSRIRGGHNFFQIRAARRPSLSHSDPVHLLLAYTRETIDVHKPNLAQGARSEEHTSELQSRENLVCPLLLEKKKQRNYPI